MKRWSILFLLVIPVMISCGAKKQSETSNGNTSGTPLQYNVPNGWIQETPATSMRKAQFELPAAGNADPAELAIFNFPGTGGSVQANLQRWYGQFKQPNGGSTQQMAQTQNLKVNGLQVTVVYVTGTYMQPESPMQMGGATVDKPDYAMLAAIVENDDSPWFVKATGPQSTIDHWRDSFNQFVQSFHF